MAEDRRPKSLIKAAAGTYLANGTAAMLSLINVLVIARALGPEGRGDVAFLIAVATLTGHIGSLSVQEANANLGGTRPELRRVLATNSLILAALLGGLAAAFVAGLVELFPAVGGAVSRPLFMLALVAIPIAVLRLYFNLLLQSDYRYGVTNFVWILGPVTTVTVNGVLAITGGLSVATAIGAWIGGQLLGTVILAIYVGRTFGFAAPSMGVAREAVAFGSKTHGARFMEIGNYRVDQWLLGAIAGSRELGLYSIAVAWAEMLYYLPGILVLVQRPDLVRASRDRAAEMVSRVFRRMAFLSGAAAIGLIIAAPFLCVVIFGEEFRGSIDDLRVLALGAIGIGALALFQNVLTAQRRPFLASATVAVAFAVTLTLNILLIPVLGGLGAAIARTVAYTVGGVGAAIVVRRVFGLDLRRLIPRRADLVWMREKVTDDLLPVLRPGKGVR